MQNPLTKENSAAEYKLTRQKKYRKKLQSWKKKKKKISQDK